MESIIRGLEVASTTSQVLKQIQHKAFLGHMRTHLKYLMKVKHVLERHSFVEGPPE